MSELSKLCCYREPPTIRCGGIVLTILLCLFACSIETTAATNIPDYVDTPAFSTPPEQLIDAFKRQPQNKLPRSATIDVLLDKTEYVIEENLQMRHVRRQIFRVLNRNAIERHGTLEAAWYPWFQNKPTIRARVITPNGAIRRLDKSAVEQLNLPSGDPRIFTDIKLLRTPLPVLSVGAIVEYEIVTEDFRSRLKSAVTHGHAIGSYFEPTRQTVATITCPDSIKLSHRCHDVSVDPRSEKSNGKSTLTFAFGSMPPLSERMEAYLPGNVSPWPMVAFSAGGSWNDVAREYNEIVESQLAGVDLTNLVRETVSPADLNGVKISKLLARVHQLVRYTGIAFGASAYVPATPTTTLQRGYGDCKDKSALLVALLRKAGIPAHVALVSIGRSMDVMPELPGLNSFDHTIVVVPGEKPLWIDPTSEYTPVGELPIVDQERWALVIDESTKHLVKTTPRSSRANSITDDVDIQLKSNGKHTTSVTTECTGDFAKQMRIMCSTLQEDQLKQFIQNRGMQLFAANKLAKYEVKRLNEIDKPFQLIAHYEESEYLALQGAYGECVVTPNSLFAYLPEELLPAPDTASSNSRPRRRPMQLARPHSKSINVHISAPFGFSITELPSDQSKTFSGLRVSAKYKRLKPNEIHAKFKLQTGEKILSVNEIAEIRTGINSLADATSKVWVQSFLFEQQAGTHLAERRIKEAVREYHRILKNDPKNVEANRDFSISLLHAGLGQPARHFARRAARMFPQNATANYALGVALAHDDLGRKYLPGFDHSLAVAALQRALELAPEDESIRLELGGLLTISNDGTRFSNPTNTAAAIQHFDSLLHTSPYENALDNLVTALCLSGKSRDALPYLQRFPATQARNVLWLCVIAMNDGVDAAIEKSATLYPDVQQRNQALAQAVDALKFLREYKASADLCRQLAPRIPASTQQLFRIADDTHIFAKAKTTKPNLLPHELVVRNMLLSAAWYGVDSNELRSYLRNPPQDLYRESQIIPVQLARGRQLQVAQGLSKDRIGDATKSLQISSEGSEDLGYRVQVKDPIVDSLVFDFFVAHDAGQFRILYTGAHDSELGKHALELVEAKRIEAAKQWLDWSYGRKRQDVGWFNVFAGDSFSRIWASSKQNDPEVIRLAAAALAADSSIARKALLVLDEFRPTATKAIQLQIDRARYRAMIQLNRFEEAKQILQEVVKLHPHHEEPTISLIHALNQLGAYDEIKDLAKNRANLLGNNDPLVNYAKIIAATGKREYKMARQYARQHESNSANFSYFYDLQIGWNLLFDKESIPQSNTHAQRAADATENMDAMSLRLTALTFAANGKVAKAVDYLHSATALTGKNTRLDPLIQGRIADACGLEKIAIEYYRTVKPREPEHAQSAYGLAKMWLNELQTN